MAISSWYARTAHGHCVDGARTRTRTLRLHAPRCVCVCACTLLNVAVPCTLSLGRLRRLQVGNVDFTYFEESPMAARARLAGYVDKSESELMDEEYDAELLEEAEAEARRLEKELDAELAEMLDSDGDVLTF